MAIWDEFKEIETSVKQLRIFGIVFSLIILGASVLFFVKHNINAAAFICGIGAVLFIQSILKPANMVYVYKAWMMFAIILNWVMIRVILGILFYVGFTGIKFIAKITGKKFLDLKIDRDKESYWIKREKKDFDRQNYERQF
jgi:hypothetical protein